VVEPESIKIILYGLTKPAMSYGCSMSFGFRTVKIDYEKLKEKAK